MPAGLTLDAERMQSWLDAVNEARDPNSRLRELLRSPDIFARPVPGTYDNLDGLGTVMWRGEHGLRVYRLDSVVQMSNVDSVASWDGHEPEDL